MLEDFVYDFFPHEHFNLAFKQSFFEFHRKSFSEIEFFFVLLSTHVVVPSIADVVSSIVGLLLGFVDRGGVSVRVLNGPYRGSGFV